MGFEAFDICIDCMVRYYVDALQNAILQGCLSELAPVQGKFDANPLNVL